MKFKILALIVVSLFCSLSVFSQERKFEIEIALEDTAIAKSEKNIPVKIKIINKAEESLRIDSLGSIYFSFSKCLSEENCKKSNDIFGARIDRLPAKKVREDESFEFEVNLADFYWNPNGESSSFAIGLFNKTPKNFSKIPAENIYFYAQIKTLDGYKEKNMGPKYDSNGKLIKYEVKKIPHYRVVNSNIINVVFN